MEEGIEQVVVHKEVGPEEVGSIEPEVGGRIGIALEAAAGRWERGVVEDDKWPAVEQVGRNPGYQRHCALCIDHDSHLSELLLLPLQNNSSCI